MLPLAALLTFPITGPIGGLGWLARKIAEAAMAEYADPARVQRALLELEAALEAGEIDEATYEAREAELLAWLDRIRPSDGDEAALADMQADIDRLDREAAR